MRMFTNVGCAGEVQCPTMLLNKPIIVTTPTGAIVQGLIEDMFESHLVMASQAPQNHPMPGHFTMRLYFRREDCPDLPEASVNPAQGVDSA